jgi:hypothetical protein
MLWWSNYGSKICDFCGGEWLWLTMNYPPKGKSLLINITRRVYSTAILTYPPPADGLYIYVAGLSVQSLRYSTRQSHHSSPRSYTSVCCPKPHPNVAPSLRLPHLPELASTVYSQTGPEDVYFQGSELQPPEFDIRLDYRFVDRLAMPIGLKSVSRTVLQE